LAILALLADEDPVGDHRGSGCLFAHPAAAQARILWFFIPARRCASLGMLAVIHVYLVISGKLVLSATGDFFLWSVLGAFMEELVFRAIAIDEFIRTSE